MNIFKTMENRRLIPRWQSLRDSYTSKEILSSMISNPKEKNQNFISEEIIRARNEWLKEKSIFSAIEYLEKQRICETEYDKDAYQLVKKFVLSNDQLPNAVRTFFNEESDFAFEYDSSQLAIKNIRSQIILHPNDAYLWLELARNHLIVGSLKKCEKALLIARSLAPNDRLISRSMMRFYHHTENIDKALYYVWKMSTLVNDPMILSGEIALCNTIGRSSRYIKQAKNMLQSQNYSPFCLSELTSEIATMEIKNGKEKKGKKLLEQSLQAPTENAIAQTTWINQCVTKLSWIEKINQLQVPNNYEGDIYFNMASIDSPIDWNHLFEQCVLWNKYQPFSRDPIYLGTNIATDFLEKYDEAFDFSIKALQNHKDESGVLNNIAYSAILNGDKKNAEKFLNLQFSKCKADAEKVVFFATKGLYEFRFGNIALGKKLYVDSYELANSLQSELYPRVLAYYFRELSIIKDYSEMSNIKQKLMKCKDYSFDFILLQLMIKFKIIE